MTMSWLASRQRTRSDPCPIASNTIIQSRAGFLAPKLLARSRPVKKRRKRIHQGCSRRIFVELLKFRPNAGSSSSAAHQAFGVARDDSMARMLAESKQNKLLSVLTLTELIFAQYSWTCPNP